MRFSIVVPVYNVAEYLNECVDSLISQSFEDFEVILVNDGSTDKSGKICDDYAKRDSRIKVIHKSNGGLSDARNVGISNSEGEYVLFLDSDDFWVNRDVLSRLDKRLKGKNTDVLVFNVCKLCGNKKSAPWLDENDMPLEFFGEKSLEYLVNRNIWLSCACDKAIKRQLFLKNNLNFTVGVTSEDIEWALRLAFFATNFDFINETVLCYRQRETSISHGMNEKKLTMLCENIEECIEYIEKQDTDKSILLKKYIAYPFGTLLYNLSFLKGRKNRKFFLKRIKNRLYVLNWSDNKKVKLLRVLCRCFGLEIGISLLSIISAIRG